MINKLSTYLSKPRNGKKGIILMSIIAFTEAIFFPIPPDPFLGFLCIKKSYRKVLHIVKICLFFSIFGGCMGYLLGEEIVNLAIKSDFSPIVNNLDKLEPLKNDINEETFLLMLASGFTPLPFKIFCIAAGIVNANFAYFLVGSILGRFLRFGLVGYLAKIFGEEFEAILKNKKVLYLSIGLIVILIIYFIYKWT
jgi:membrane protein YqaA with SNARE-associated domain